MNRALLALAAALPIQLALGQTTPAPTTPAQPAAKAAKPKIYDEKADAKQQIAQALAAAKRDHSRVLIQWGANWCGWCHLLHGTFKTDPKIAKTLNYEYVVVLVDIGQFDKNMDLAAQYGADLKSGGVPYITILDADGKVVINQETGSLERPAPKDGEKAEPSHDPDKVLAFLTAQKAPAVKADDVLAAGLKQAEAEGKMVFLHYGAPWCGWCHKLEAWMARPEVAAILAKDFIDVKIDTDRMPGGEDLYKKQAGNNGGIPWIAFIAPNGDIITTGTDAKGENIGFPAQPSEIEHFAGMLKKAHKNISDSEIATLTDSLKKK